MCHLSYYIEEGWDFNVSVLLGSLNSKKRGLTVHIKERFHQEILLFIDETLPDFFQYFLVGRLTLFILFYEFTRRNLSPFFYAFVTVVRSHFMAVGE